MYRVKRVRKAIETLDWRNLIAALVYDAKPAVFSSMVATTVGATTYLLPLTTSQCPTESPSHCLRPNPARSHRLAV